MNHLELFAVRGLNYWECFGNFHFSVEEMRARLDNLESFGATRADVAIIVQGFPQVLLYDISKVNSLLWIFREVGFDIRKDPTCLELDLEFLRARFVYLHSQNGQVSFEELTMNGREFRLIYRMTKAKFREHVALNSFRFTILHEAQAAVQRLIPVPKDIRGYIQVYGQDPRLYCHPKEKYPNDWVDWRDYLGTMEPRRRKSRRKKQLAKYQTFASVRAAVQRLVPIPTTNSQYRDKCWQNPRLRVAVGWNYPDDWVDWYDFLGTTKPKRRYPRKKYRTFDQAKAAVQRLVPIPKTGPEYHKLYDQDPRLRYAPNVDYSRRWVDWYDFLGTPSPKKRRKRKTPRKEKYSTFRRAKAAVQRLDPIPTGITEYREVYTQDPRLRIDPRYSYPDDWVDWYHYLGTKRPTEKYETLEQAKAAVQRLVPIPTSGPHYDRIYSQDEKLPATPRYSYPEDWIDWYDYLGTPRP